MESVRSIGLEHAKQVATPAAKEYVDKKGADMDGAQGVHVEEGRSGAVGSDARFMADVAGWISQGDADVELGDEDARVYKSVVARLNYFAPLRPDVLFAVRECAKSMARPTVSSMTKLKRIARYLKGKPRLQVLFPVESNVREIAVYRDSDWAGCQRTRKSVSAGQVQVGLGLVKGWSKDQSHVALSSAEAELYAANLGAQIAIAVSDIAGAWGVKATIGLGMDASGAIGVLQRRGAGKLRHIEANELWLQGCVKQGKIVVRKVQGIGNSADHGV